MKLKISVGSQLVEAVIVPRLATIYIQSKSRLVQDIILLHVCKRTI
jgi:hypothetical protein